MKTLFAILFFLLCGTAAEAVTRYASVTGGGATCTDIKTPCTVNTAISQTASGDTVLIRAGTYNQSIAWPSNGSSGAPTIIAAYPGGCESVTCEVVTFNTPSSSGLNISGGGPIWVTFDGLIVDGTNTGTAFVNGFGLCCHYASHVVFKNGEIRNFGGNGIELFTEDFTLRNSRIHNNGSNTTAGPPHGVYVNCHSGCIFEDNQVYDNDHFGFHVFGDSDGQDSHNIIRRNRVYGNGKSTVGLNVTGFGILLSGGTDNQAYNNVVYDNGRTGQDGGGIRIYPDCSNCLVYSNTVYNNANYGIDIRSGASSPIVRNNITWGNLVGSIIDAGASSPTLSNNYCNLGSGCSGVNSSSNPFTNAGAGNFNLVGGSAAIDAGFTLNSPYDSDIALVLRPQGKAYDMGAYELVAAAPPAPTVTITVPTSSPTFNTAGISTVTLSGSSSISGGSVAWTCNRCTVTSGSATGTLSWVTPEVTLRSGINIITVTHTTAAGGVGSDTLTVTYPPTFSGNALVAAYAFESITGAAVSDSTVYANTATIFNGAAQVDAKFGKGVRLNPASSQYVSIPDANQIDFTQSFTFSLWLKPAHVPSGFQAAIVKNYMIALYASQNGAYCTSGGPVIWFEINGGIGSPASYSACYGTPLTVGQWSHLAGTYDGANLKLYINGALVTTTPASGYIEPSGNSAMIGNSQSNEYFDGDVDEVRIYNYAIPRLGALNTTPNMTCQNASEEASSPVITPVEGWSGPSIVGSMNCPIIPLAPPIAFKIGAASTFKLGASSSLKVGGVPQ